MKGDFDEIVNNLWVLAVKAVDLMVLMFIMLLRLITRCKRMAEMTKRERSLLLATDTDLAC